MNRSRRVELAVLRHENPPSPKPFEPEPEVFVRLVDKVKMCHDCPHMHTPDNCDPERYAKVRKFLKRVLGDVTKPHPCHQGDGTYCAGPELEKKRNKRKWW